MSVDPTKAERLRMSLQSDIRARFTSSWAETYGTGILANPQAHIDALVEAGVLAPVANDRVMPGLVAYAVVPPHEHEWWLHGLHLVEPPRPLTEGTVTVQCACGARRTIPNRLPIEVPS